MAKTPDIKKFHLRLYDVDELIYDINDYVSSENNKKKYETKFMDINNLYFDRFKMPNYDLDVIFKPQQITHLPEDNYPSGLINQGKPIDVIGFVRINKNLKTNVRLIEYFDRQDTVNIHNPINVNNVIKTLLSELVLNDKTRHILLPIINVDAAGSDLAKYPEIKPHIDQDKIYSVEITERFFKMFTLDAFLKENELDDYVLVNTLFGIIEPLYEINTYYPKFKHNYLLPETIDCYVRTSQNNRNNKLIQTVIPNIKLSNFYLSEIEDVIRNEYLANSGLPEMGPNFAYNDIYTALNDIWKKYSDSILKTTFMTNLFEQLLPEKIRSKDIYLTKKMWDLLTENEKDSLNIKNVYGIISKQRSQMKDERNLLLKDKLKNDSENMTNSRIVTEDDEEPESDINVNDLSPDDMFDEADETAQMDELELSGLTPTETMSELELSGLTTTEQDLDSEDKKMLPEDSPEEQDLDSEGADESDDLSSTPSREVEESGIKTSRNKNKKSYNNDIKNMSNMKKRSKVDNVIDGQVKLKKYRGTRLIDPHIGANHQKKNLRKHHNYQNYENGYMQDNYEYPDQMESGPKINSLGNFFGVNPGSLAQNNGQFGQKFGNQSYPVGQIPQNKTSQVPAPINNENDIINRYMAANAGNMPYSQPNMRFGDASARPQMDMQFGDMSNGTRMPPDANQMASQQLAAQQMAAQQAMMQQAMASQQMGPEQQQQQAMMEMMRQNQTGGYHPNPNFFFQH